MFILLQDMPVAVPEYSRFSLKESTHGSSYFKGIDSWFIVMVQLFSETAQFSRRQSEPAHLQAKPAQVIFFSKTAICEILVPIDCWIEWPSKASLEGLKAMKGNVRELSKVVGLVFKNIKKS